MQSNQIIQQNIPLFEEAAEKQKTTNLISNENQNANETIITKTIDKASQATSSRGSLISWFSGVVHNIYDRIIGASQPKNDLQLSKSFGEVPQIRLPSQSLDDINIALEVYKRPQYNFVNLETVYQSVIRSVANPYLTSFILVVGEEQIGKSVSFIKLAEKMQKFNQPVLYVPLHSHVTSLENITQQMELKSLDVLNRTLVNFNAQNQTPTIIFDNAEFFINYQNKICTACQSLIEIYDLFQVNFVLVSNKQYAKLFFEEERIMKRRIESFSVHQNKSALHQFIVDFSKEFFGATDNEVQNLKRQMNQCENLRIMTWDFLTQFFKNAKKGKLLNLQKFCEDDLKTNLSESINKMTQEANIQQLVQIMLQLMQSDNAAEYSNKWVTFSQIRHSFQQQGIQNTVLIQQLEQGMQNEIIISQQNQFKFKNKSIFSVMLYRFGHDEYEIEE